MKLIVRLLLFAFVVAGVGIIGCEDKGGGPCTADGDCKTAGQTCVSGTCQAPGEGTPSDGGDGGSVDAPPPKPCQDETECAETEICKDSKCLPIPAKCAANDDCRSGHTCADGTCFKNCAFDDDCPTDKTQACDATKKHCIEVKKCTKKEDCDADQACNTCRGVCTAKVGQDCDQAFNCTDLGGADFAWCDPCVKQCRKKLTICQPCTKHEQCGNEGDLCVADLLNPQSGKKYCAQACVAGNCPSKYSCKALKEEEYKSSPNQCLPASGDCANPSACSSNLDCINEGKICDVVKGLCIAGCQEDNNCPVRTTTACSDKSDCKNSSAVCDAGKCSVQQKCCRGTCGSPCAQDSECEAQEKCDQGCCKVDGECRSSKDCKDKQFCDKKTGLCTDGCEIADDCGAPDPQKARCRWTCPSGQCVEDCTCRSAALDCAESVRFCPTKAEEAKDPLAPCRKPVGPFCKSCAGDGECGCKAGDDCPSICTKMECKADDECKAMPGGATSCYNGRCSTKKACRNNADCASSGEKCENGFCAENCNNICLNLMTGARCFTGCDITKGGEQCPSRTSCTELTPQSGSGPACKGSSKNCSQDSDCSGTQNRCGEDGYCTECKTGMVCRNLDKMDPLNLICIPMPPTICVNTGTDICKDGGF